MKKYLLALDEGTTSARAILFDRYGGIAAMANQAIRQIYPQPGWVEQDPMDIYAAQVAALTECVAKSGIHPDEIAAVGITNQRETALLWERATGTPVSPAIVWQCRRTADRCTALYDEGYAEMIRAKTGLRPDAYFSATKWEWIFREHPDLLRRAQKGELAAGTVDTWLAWKLSDGRIHVTDRTNAARTMLYNLHTDTWDEELLRLFGIPHSVLPEVRSSGEVYGEIAILGTPVPLAGIAGDQQSALFGHRCFAPGDAKNTYGTGCFLLMHTGQTAVDSRMWSAHHRRGGRSGQTDGICPGGERLCRRGGDPVAAGRNAPDRPRRAVRGGGEKRIRYGRGVHRAGIHGSGCAVLGSPRPRDDHGTDPRLRQSAYCPCRTGIDRVPDRGCACRHAHGCCLSAFGTAGRWRRVGERFSHAAPVRSLRRACPAPPDHRSDCVGCCLSCRIGRRLLPLAGRDPGESDRRRFDPQIDDGERARRIHGWQRAIAATRTTE